MSKVRNADIIPTGDANGLSMDPLSLKKQKGAPNGQVQEGDVEKKAAGNQIKTALEKMKDVAGQRGKDGVEQKKVQGGTDHTASTSEGKKTSGETKNTNSLDNQNLKNMANEFNRMSRGTVKPKEGTGEANAHENHDLNTNTRQVTLSQPQAAAQTAAKNISQQNVVSQFAYLQAGKRSAVEVKDAKQTAKPEPKGADTKDGSKTAQADAVAKTASAVNAGGVQAQVAAKSGEQAAAQMAKEAVKEKTQLNEETADNSIEAESAKSPHAESRAVKKELGDLYGGVGSGTTSGGESGALDLSASREAVKEPDDPESFVESKETQLGSVTFNKEDLVHARVRIAAVEFTSDVEQPMSEPATIEEKIANYTQVPLDARFVASLKEETVDLIRQARELMNTTGRYSPSGPGISA